MTHGPILLSSPFSSATVPGNVRGGGFRRLIPNRLDIRPGSGILRAWPAGPTTSRTTPPPYPRQATGAALCLHGADGATYGYPHSHADRQGAGLDTYRLPSPATGYPAVRTREGTGGLFTFTVHGHGATRHGRQRSVESSVKGRPITPARRTERAGAAGQTPSLHGICTGETRATLGSDPVQGP